MRTIPTSSMQRNRAISTTLPRKRGYVSVASMVTGAALFMCATSPSSAASVSPVRIQSNSVGGMLLLREEDIVFSPTEALSEIRNKAGLTWAQLSALLGVSRRAIHEWTKGGCIKPENASSISSLLDRVREFGAMPAFKIRNELTTPAPSEATPYDANPIPVSDPRPPKRQLKPVALSSLRVI